MKKYDYFIVATENGSDTFESYMGALTEYSQWDSVTLYGVSGDDYNVIYSK